MMQERQVESGYRRQRQGGQEYDYTHAEQLKQNKGGASEEPQADMKAVFQELVGGYRVHSSQAGYVGKGNQRRYQHNAAVYDDDRPIRSIYPRWKREISDGAQLRAEDTDTGGPPWNGTPSQVEVRSGVSLTAAYESHKEQAAKIRDQCDPVQSAECRIRRQGRNLPNDRGTNPRPDFP